MPLKTLTPRDIHAFEQYRAVTGCEMENIDQYLSGAWEWDALWDDNFNRVVPVRPGCRCRFEALRYSGRRNGYPLSIQGLERLGFHFTLLKGGGSWYEDAWYRCDCGQVWKEEFVEAMQYNGNHAHPVSADEVP